MGRLVAKMDNDRTRGFPVRQLIFPVVSLSLLPIACCTVAPPLLVAGADKVAARLFQVAHDDCRGGVDIAVAQGLVKGAVLHVVIADARWREDLFFHTVPLTVPAHVVYLPVEPRHQRITRAFGEEHMELFVSHGEGLLVGTSRLNRGQCVANLVQIARGGVHGGQACDVRLNR